MNNTISCALLILITAVLSPFLTAQPKEAPHPGSRKTLEEAANLATTIVTGKLVKRGPPTLEHTGSAGYSIQIQVTKTLKGAGSGILDKASLSVSRLSDSKEETTPEEGKEYLFFIEPYVNGYLHALKVLPATAENIAAATAVISK